MSKPLTVYKASAGSGKTFTLAVEYIRLLIDNPQSYRNILAVTFTNKATEEMKQRILSQLYGIAHSLPDSDDYLKKIMETSPLSEPQIRERALQALTLLMHNYNYFNVETIDAFFQSVLRNLARELDLTANLKLQLNDRQIEEQAVDEMIDELNNNSPEFKWILDYIKENMSEDRSWNIISQVKSFGENIFKDFYKEHEEQLDSTLKKKDFFKDYTAKLRNIMTESKKKLDGFATEFFDKMKNHDIGELQYGKSGVAGYFFKLQNGVYDAENLLKKRVVDALKNPEAWVKKSTINSNEKNIYSLVCDELHPLLKRAEEARPELARKYYSAEITLKHLNQLRLLQSIAQKVAAMNEENGNFMLSNTQKLLGDLIDGSDSPFIYEKIGSRLEHIMIDEFQDTSTVQWKNFKVLLEDTMSHGADTTQENPAEAVTIKNLIVGDVKQSIYRWRSGDWRLLNNIKDEFGSDAIDQQGLATNYRSQRNIIRFNNEFFNQATKIEAKKIDAGEGVSSKEMSRAYSDVAQEVPEGKADKGYVEVRLLPKENYKDETLDQIAQIISELLEAGEKTQNICILVRSRKTIQNIGDYLMRVMPDVPLVSEEAFRLEASMAVNTIVYAMRLLATSDDGIAKAYLVKTWLKVNDKETDFVPFEKFDEILPQEFMAAKEELLRMPMVDMAERIFEIFHLERFTDQGAYVCAFYDELNKYLQDNIPDVNNFWKAWNDSIHDKTIMSSEPDGIQLMTIHKSKGLEFNTVIMPYCDWALENKRDNVLWCSPQEEPYSDLSLVPVDFSSKLSETIYNDEYQQEHMQNIVDNLNLLYVAFTRAGSNLYVMGKNGATDNDRSALLNDVIDSVADALPANTTEEEGLKILTFGEPVIKEKKEKKSENVFLQSVDPELLNIESFHNPAHFRQSNDSKDFISEEIEDDDQKERKSYIRMGNVLHNLFSTINTIDDIPKALKSLENDGVLYDENITAERLQNMLQKRFENQQVKDWFSSNWTLFNECTILRYDEFEDKVVERRPDRVMTDGDKMIVVDFKFGKPRNEYHDQVREYMTLLEDMGYKNIEGYLWFVYSNKIERV